MERKKNRREHAMSEALLYLGHVAHTRTSPARNFRLAHFYLEVPLEESSPRTPLLGIDRRALFSVLARHHSGSPKATLYENTKKLAGRFELPLKNIELSLITIPALFGYVFNPVSFLSQEKVAPGQTSCGFLPRCTTLPAGEPSTLCARYERRTNIPLLPKKIFTSLLFLIQRADINFGLIFLPRMKKFPLRLIIPTRKETFFCRPASPA